MSWVCGGIVLVSCMVGPWNDAGSKYQLTGPDKSIPQLWSTGWLHGAIQTKLSSSFIITLWFSEKKVIVGSGGARNFEKGNTAHRPSRHLSYMQIMKYLTHLHFVLEKASCEKNSKANRGAPIASPLESATWSLAAERRKVRAGTVYHIWHICIRYDSAKTVVDIRFISRLTTNCIFHSVCGVCWRLCNCADVRGSRVRVTLNCLLLLLRWSCLCPRSPNSSLTAAHLSWDWTLTWTSYTATPGTSPARHHSLSLYNRPHVCLTVFVYEDILQ